MMLSETTASPVIGFVLMLGVGILAIVFSIIQCIHLVQDIRDRKNKKKQDDTDAED